MYNTDPIGPSPFPAPQNPSAPQHTAPPTPLSDPIAPAASTAGPPLQPPPTAPPPAPHAHSYPLSRTSSLRPATVWPPPIPSTPYSHRTDPKKNRSPASTPGNEGSPAADGTSNSTPP